jgi:hypothetical protein
MDQADSKQLVQLGIDLTCQQLLMGGVGVLQGYALEERLLEFRCGRYFYVDAIPTFLPVPDVPKDYNKQLRTSAAALAATHDPRWAAGSIVLWEYAKVRRKQVQYMSVSRASADNRCDRCMVHVQDTRVGARACNWWGCQRGGGVARY